MPVARSTIPYRKSRRLRQTDPKHYADDDDLWEPYDEALLEESAAPCPVKSEPTDTFAPASPNDLPVDVPGAAEPAAYIPRPRNAFICFRSAYVKAEKSVSVRPKSLDQTVMSCGAGDVWRGMSKEERHPYVTMAQREKEAHALKYPNYRYAPGSSTGAARKPKKAKAVVSPKRASPATSDASDARMRSPVSVGRPSRHYEPHAPVPRLVSRKTSTSAARRQRRRPSASAATPTALVPEPLEAVAEVPEPSPQLAASPSVDKVHDSKLESNIPASPPPYFYDRNPTQFGFKKDLSPTVIESLNFAPTPPPSPSPSPAMQTPTFSFPNYKAESGPRAPSPVPPHAWDSWMYVPLEMPDNTLDLEFDAPPADLGFFHPWEPAEDAGPSTPGTVSDDVFMF